MATDAVNEQKGTSKRSNDNRSRDTSQIQPYSAEIAHSMSFRNNGYGNQVIQAMYGYGQQLPVQKKEAEIESLQPLPSGNILQKKLSIGSPDDRYEKEADAMADQVMRMPEIAMQQKCAHCEAEEGKVQMKPLVSSITHVIQATANEQSETSEEISNQIQATQGSGCPMEHGTRNFMEQKFGTDFSGVNVHTGSQAVQMSRELNAQAFTTGNDIYFNAGKYSPESSEGKHLLAHELTHTIQQTGKQNISRNTIQKKATAIRFQKDPVLEEVSDGKRILKKGDKGIHVTKIEQALADLGLYQPSIISGSYDYPVEAAVSQLQTIKGMKGAAISGNIDKATFDIIDNSFINGYAVEQQNIGTQKTGKLLDKTRTITDPERAGIADAISTQQTVNPVTGKLPTFAEEVKGKGKYSDRLKKALEAEVISQYNSMGKGREALHKDPKNLQEWTQLEAVATESKKAVDGLFGQYTTGPAFKKNVNIFDAWEDKEKDMAAGGKAEEDRNVSWRVQKILDGDEVIAQIDHEHGAIQSRPAEEAIVKPIKSSIMAKWRKELLDTHKGWPAFAGSGKVYIQLFKEKTNQGNRTFMWDLFQTVIHEYIHTLEHPDHVAYRKTMDEQKGGFTLREGTTDYFTKVVWNSINLSNVALRKAVEGPYHDPTVTHPVPNLGTYKESANAERLAGIVGIRNVAAAFFLGKVELIGKK